MLRLYRPGATPAKDQQLDNLVRDVVECSAVDVVRQLPADMSRMGLAELRGYIRARAVRPVRHHARTLVAQTGHPASAADVLANRALERTIQLVLRQLSSDATIVLRAAG